MLQKSAIKAFFARERQSFDRWKTYTDDKLQRMADELEIAPPIWSKLSRHQKVCLLIGLRVKRFLFLLDTGMGKTLTAIAIQRYLRKLGVLDKKRCLVLVPNKANKWEWAREIEKHSSRTSYLVLDGSSEKKWWDLMACDSDIVIDTYAGFSRMLCTRVPGKKGREKLKPVNHKVHKVALLVGMLVLDESTAVKYHRTLPYRISRIISFRADYVFALTGTPFGRNPEDLWSQFFVVDRGYTLGETLGLFRAAFFKEKQNHWGGMEYNFDRKKEAELNRVIANRSIRYEAAEGDLPQLVSIVKKVSLPEEMGAYYEKAKKTLIAARGNFGEMKNSFIRMRQISSGFIGYEDDETGKRAQLEFTDNPKLDLLLSIIESIPEKYKVIVFHDFIFSGSMICRELDKMGIGNLRLHGGTKDPQAVLRAFDRDKDKQVFVLNSAAGGFGLNLQVARYGIYYEHPVSVITGRQTIKRFHRQMSQHEKVFRYDLVVRGTFDEQILKYHEQGRSLFDAIVNGEHRVK